MDSALDWNKLDTYAKQWIKEAGNIIRNSFSSQLMIQTKTSPDDLVTNMDHEIEQFFIERITKNFPGHRILGEEGVGDNVQTLVGIVWIIDPIDGTMNFVHQQRNFAISIGIYENGVGKIGLIFDVVSGDLYHAQKGQGAFLNDVSLPKLKNVKLEEAVIGINATWVTENKRIDPTKLAPLIKRVRGTRSYGSAAIELAYVAAGRLDAYITMRLSPWDFAAGLVLIEEVGGLVTTIEGKSLKLLEQNSVFASNASFHDEVVDTYVLGKNE
ncbi:inositol monophosphatase family protein [Bacillus suaedaesalsae]|uniref:inositol-phosphate phosphatase n=1 Tax=Bacillus suaedaesalsae TaxID=2810349 RepID=A0ABS2DJE1_9BACI|nr:inositol monophosphatase family protein [Bacillus suaedaesalsae]MBM6618610.1 inositol monophosphatase family protein [Bacillus suaedaesalsae]